MKEIHFSGKNLLIARENAEMSRFDLAKAIGFMVGQQTIANYELGRRIPNFNVAIRIAQALKISPKNLTDAKS